MFTMGTQLRLDCGEQEQTQADSQVSVALIQVRTNSSSDQEVAVEVVRREITGVWSYFEGRAKGNSRQPGCEM